MRSIIPTPLYGLFIYVDKVKIELLLSALSCGPTEIRTRNHLNVLDKDYESFIVLYYPTYYSMLYRFV